MSDFAILITVSDRGQAQPMSDQYGQTRKGVTGRERSGSGTGGADPGVRGTVSHPAVSTEIQTGTTGCAAGRRMKDLDSQKS